MTVTAADALDVLQHIAACHRRTAPKMDDREAAIATAGIWAELFNAHRLTRADLLAAVKLRAQHEPGAPEPAEIISFARKIRRDRAERMTDDERRAREDAIDAKLEALEAAEQRAAIAAGRPAEVVDAEIVDVTPEQAAANRARLAEMIAGVGKSVRDAGA